MIERFLVPVVIVLAGVMTPLGIILALYFDNAQWLFLCLFLVLFMA